MNNTFGEGAIQLIPALDPGTFSSVNSWVLGAAATVAIAVLAVKGAMLSPTIVGRVFNAFKRAAGI